MVKKSYSAKDGPRAQHPHDPILPLDRWKEFRRKLPYGVVKTGYKIDDNDKCLLVPDVEQIFWIEQAFDHLQNGNTLRETAEWLIQKLHKTVTHQTLSNLYRDHRKPYTYFKTEKREGPKQSAATKKLIAEKNKAKAAVRKLAKLEAEAEARRKSKKLKPEDFDQPRIVKEKPPSPVFTNISDDETTRAVNILFKPNPGPQTEFIIAPEQEVLYGGAAGGGKTFAMIADPLRYVSNPNFVGLLIRRTNDELKEILREQHKLYKKIPGLNAEFKAKESVWKFGSGAELWVTYLDREDDVYRYQGQSFCWIGIDELTQYASPFAYLYLKSRLRTTDPELKPFLSIRCTTNPGGPGHQWVKKMFVDPAVPGKSFWATDIETGEILRYPEDYHDPEKAGKPLFKRRFIPAKLSDNPYLAEDGAYERSLLGLPPDQRRKLLDGDWSVMEGAAFPEFNPKIHVTEPFDVPDGWRKFRAGDFGYSSHSAVLWFAIAPEGTLYVYRELYVSKKTGQDLAKLVKQAERDDMNMSYGVLDSSVWHQRGHYGPSIAEEMIQAGCRWRPSDRTAGSRIAGKNRLHELLKINPMTDKPGIIFFNTCRQLLADLPMLPSDPDGGEDIDDRYTSDHTYDALRYGIMSRPRPGMSPNHGGMPRDTYIPFDKTFGY